MLIRPEQNGQTREIDLIIADYFDMLRMELLRETLCEIAKERGAARSDRPLPGRNRIQTPKYQRRPADAWDAVDIWLQANG